MITAMEEGQLAFAPQNTIEVVKEKKKSTIEKKELLARNSKLEDQVVSQSETFTEMRETIAKFEAMLAK